MSIRDIPREDLHLGVTRLRVLAGDHDQRECLFAGFPRDRVGVVLGKLPESVAPYEFSVDDVEVMR